MKHQNNIYGNSVSEQSNKEKHDTAKIEVGKKSA